MMAFKTLSIIGFTLIGVVAAPPHAPSVRWGEPGHRMVAEAAASKLPPTMPEFFRNAGPQLSYLNPEPDRWRDRGESGSDPAMNGAHSPEHFVDFELITPRALSAPDRYAYMDSLRAAGVKENPGLLPYRMLELTQRLRVQFKLWRNTTDPEKRAFIESRIINDAGILGHYVADGANPHHTSVHHNGWVGANPKGYATDRDFHWRFESSYVQKNLRLPDVTALMTSPAVVRAPVRDSIVTYLRRSHDQLDTLYSIDKRARFDSTTTAPENRRFTARRLAAGAEMLRDLWWTAWETSALPPAPRAAPPQ